MFRVLTILLAVAIAPAIMQGSLLARCCCAVATPIGASLSCAPDDSNFDHQSMSTSCCTPCVDVHNVKPPADHNGHHNDDLPTPPLCPCDDCPRSSANAGKVVVVTTTAISSVFTPSTYPAPRLAPPSNGDPRPPHLDRLKRPPRPAISA